MRAREKQILAELLEQIGDNAWRLRQVPLTAFCAIRGDDAAGGLFVAGRALNGWMAPGWLPEEARSADHRNEIVRDLYTRLQRYPMTWVSDQWEIQTKWSAFWRVIRSVVAALGIADYWDERWPCRLIWSNLYKVSPFDGGNPSATLCKVQLDYCLRLLSEEFSQWLPQRVLMLTGVDWAEPFMDGLALSRSHKELKYVEAVGTVRLPKAKHTTTIVVAKHPQGKPEAAIVSEIASSFGGQECRGREV